MKSKFVTILLSIALLFVTNVGHATSKEVSASPPKTQMTISHVTADETVFITDQKLFYIFENNAGIVHQYVYKQSQSPGLNNLFISNIIVLKTKNAISDNQLPDLYNRQRLAYNDYTLNVILLKRNLIRDCYNLIN